MARIQKITAAETRYRDGAEQGMPGGVIVPKAMNVSDGSGARFSVLPVEHNIVEVDDNGNEIKRKLSKAGLQRLMQNKEGGRRITINEVLDGADVQKSVNDDLTLNDADVGMETSRLMTNGGTPFLDTSVNDDASSPSTEETIPMSRMVEAKARINPPPVVEEEPESDVPVRPDNTPAVLPPPPPRMPVITSRPPIVKAGAERGPDITDGQISPNIEVQEVPEDLDLEPDPGLGPKRLSSYAIPLRKSVTEAPPEPLIKPAMMPKSMREIPAPPEGADPNAAYALALQTHANLDIEPMQVARVRVRFVGPFGKLAVPYNVVFRHDYSLVMLQYSPDGSFYEPPGGLEQHIEVQWHGRIFMCLPGPYFIMPDQQTAVTVFLIDDARTLEVQYERESREAK
jgi:hypothetical protein